ncbi:retrotransposon protein, putative, ty1-copia subclass [Tanacetum coccineum]
MSSKQLFNFAFKLRLLHTKKDNDSKGRQQLHHCGDSLGLEKELSVYLTELIKKKKDYGKSEADEKPGALSLYRGRMVIAATLEAIGTYHLELPSGLVIVLNNCHYAPSITRGVILGWHFEIVISWMVIYGQEFLRSSKRAWDYCPPHSSLHAANKECQDEEKFEHVDIGSIIEESNTLLKSFWDYALENCCDSQHWFQKVDKDTYDIWLEHELGDLGEPANYKAALLDPESKKWLDAMNVEMQSMKDNDVWVLVELLPMLNRWLASGFLGKRLEMDGCTIAAYYDYEIWQMDVKTAFLNGHLSEEVYMEQPEGNGIRDLMMNSRKFGFTQNPDDPCVYLKASGGKFAILILYVDDILLMGNNIPMLQDVKSYLGRSFAMKDLGDAAYILGIKIYRDRENFKVDTIPMQEKLKMSKSQGASTPAENSDMQIILSFVADWRGREAVWIRKFIYGLGIVPTIEEPISMYCDNTGAIAIAKDDGVTKGGRHFRAKVSLSSRDHSRWVM